MPNGIQAVSAAAEPYPRFNPMVRNVLRRLRTAEGL